MNLDDLIKVIYARSPAIKLLFFLFHTLFFGSELLRSATLMGVRQGTFKYFLLFPSCPFLGLFLLDNFLCVS